MSSQCGEVAMRCHFKIAGWASCTFLLVHDSLRLDIQPWPFEFMLFLHVLLWKISSTQKGWKNRTGNTKTSPPGIYNEHFVVFALSHTHPSIHPSFLPSINLSKSTSFFDAFLRLMNVRPEPNDTVFSPPRSRPCCTCIRAHTLTCKTPMCTHHIWLTHVP